MLHLKYFPHPHKPSGGYLSKLSTADTCHVQQLTSSWKAVNAARKAKALVFDKNKPLTSYNLGERLMLCMAETIPHFVFVYFIAVVIATVRYISSM